MRNTDYKLNNAWWSYECCESLIFIFDGLREEEPYFRGAISVQGYYDEFVLFLEELTIFVYVTHIIFLNINIFKF